MKHLGKIVAVAAIAALSLSCASALAKGDTDKNGTVTPTAQADVEERQCKHGRKGGKDAAKKPELTEEEKAARAEKAKEKLAEKLEAGKITQEEYDAELAKIESGDFGHGRKGGKDAAKKLELTEEEKAARAEKAKEKLAEKLEAGKITQEEYDAELAKIESGDFGHGRKGGKDAAKKPELTEEEKAARAEKAKEKLAEKLEAGKITQEEYDAELAKIESGNYGHGRKGGKDAAKKPQSETENAAAAE